MSKARTGLAFYKKKKQIDKALIVNILQFVFWGIAMAILAFVFVYCFGIKTTVIGLSMEPELYNNQEIFINRFTYFLSEPKSADVIVFRPNGNSNSHYYVKRLVGVPGDKLVISDGILYVNDKPYLDSVIIDKIENPGIIESELTLGADEYFVIGDNINNSEDSRASNVGIVKREYIVGKAWFHMACEEAGMGLID